MKAKAATDETQARLLAAAGRGFRTAGYGGAGVDALAKGAGLTSGAFYSHFGSKAEAFRRALIDGLAFLRAGVGRFQGEHGAGWQHRFVDFYFGERLAVGLEEACALPTFASDAARGDDATRAAYQDELTALVEQVAAGLDGDDARDRAWRLLILFAGGAGLARAVADPAIRAEIIAAATAAAAAA